MEIIRFRCFTAIDFSFCENFFLTQIHPFWNLVFCRFVMQEGECFLSNLPQPLEPQHPLNPPYLIATENKHENQEKIISI